MSGLIIVVVVVVVVAVLIIQIWCQKEMVDMSNRSASRARRPWRGSRKTSWVSNMFGSQNQSELEFLSQITDEDGDWPSSGRVLNTSRRRKANTSTVESVSRLDDTYPHTLEIAIE